MTQWPENAAYSLERLLQQSARALEERGNAQRLGTCMRLEKQRTTQEAIRSQQTSVQSVQRR